MHRIAARSRLSLRLLLSFAIVWLAVFEAPRAAFATENAPRKPSASIEAQIRSALAQRYPSIRIDAINETPVAGLYEVVAGTDIAYVDAKADHMLLGQLVDTRSRRSLTNERRDAVGRIDFEQLPLKDALVMVKGDGSRRLAVFSDPDCPYCQQLEKDLEGIADVTVYTFLFPLRNLHPDAERKAQAILCAADPLMAWQDWMIRQRSPDDAPASCLRGTAGMLELGERLRVTTTPTLFFSDGRRVGGAMPKADLEAALAAASKAPIKHPPATTSR